MCVCVHIYIMCICMCIHIYNIHVSVCVLINIHMYLFKYVYMHMCANVCIYIYLSIYILYVFISIYVCISSYICSRYICSRCELVCACVQKLPDLWRPLWDGTWASSSFWGYWISDKQCYSASLRLEGGRLRRRCLTQCWGSMRSYHCDNMQNWAFPKVRWTCHVCSDIMRHDE